jgi:hypothetical protein
VQGRVDDYLLRVDQVLARVGADMAERRVVGVKLRARIQELLAARGHGETLSAADADAVLAELGPPETHLNDAAPPEAGASEAAAGGAASRAAQAGPPKLSGLALLGAIWSLGFLLMVIVSAIPIEVEIGQAPPAWVQGVQFIVLPLGWSAPIGTTALGVVAIGRIQRSRGALYGLSLAVFDALLFPLLLLDAVVFWMCWEVARQFQDHLSAAVLKVISQALPTVACVLGDYFLAARVWLAVQEAGAKRRRR